jgi:hypothetical protein
MRPTGPLRPQGRSRADHGRARLGNNGLLAPALPSGRHRVAAKNWRRSGRSPFGLPERKNLTGKWASMAARAWPKGGATMARDGRRGGRLRAREAGACRRGALGGDSEVGPQPRRPTDGGGGGGGSMRHRHFLAPGQRGKQMEAGGRLGP